MTPMHTTPVVSIIGRPNVGKSSIFNRLIHQSTRALTFDLPGVTRDRHYAIATFRDARDIEDRDAIVVDTGGFYPEKVDADVRHKEDRFFNIMADHAKLAIDESDLVLFVMDIREGLLPFDRTISDYLWSTKKEFWIVLNKFDSAKQEGGEMEFYELGVDQEKMFLVSAAHGRGFQDLRERIHTFISTMEGQLLQKGVRPREEVVASLALIGRPNAGKSTLLNQLVGSERALVSDIPGTTVDPIEAFFDLHFGDDVAAFDDARTPTTSSSLDSDESMPPDTELIEFEDVEATIFDSDLSNDESDEAQEEIEPAPIQRNPWRSVKIVDTAGIRKKDAIKGFIETQSVYRSLRCISDSDIVIMLVDADQGLSHQDRRLCDIALEKGKSLIVAMNKVDLLREQFKDHKKRKEWMKDLRDTIPWLEFCEIVPISAKYRKNMSALREAIKRTILVRHMTIPTGKLNRCIQDLIHAHSMLICGREFKVKYASMVKSTPPTFILFANRSKDIPDNYRRYLQHGIRKHFELYNTPVHLVIRSNQDLEKELED